MRIAAARRAMALPTVPIPTIPTRLPLNERQSANDSICPGAVTNEPVRLGKASQQQQNLADGNVRYVVGKRVRGGSDGNFRPWPQRDQYGPSPR